ncbi:MAG: hypothetical protein J6P74_01085 [Paludibacteraceae bacterium]|nr:hypothetical protein [Paludibacteraceae bacterium]
MEWSDWIAIAALGFSLWVYFKHDRKIKSLEKEKLERETLENKRARFDVRYDWIFVRHVLNLQNIGKSTAKNIVISIDNKEPLTFQDGTTQYKINQLEVTEKAEPIPLNGGYQHAIKVKLTWDDESGKGVTQTAFVEDEGGNEFMRK